MGLYSELGKATGQMEKTARMALPASANVSPFGSQMRPSSFRPPTPQPNMGFGGGDYPQMPNLSQPRQQPQIQPQRPAQPSQPAGPPAADSFRNPAYLGGSIASWPAAIAASRKKIPGMGGLKGAFRADQIVNPREWGNVYRGIKDPSSERYLDYGRGEGTAAALSMGKIPHIMIPAMMASGTASELADWTTGRGVPTRKELIGGGGDSFVDKYNLYESKDPLDFAGRMAGNLYHVPSMVKSYGNLGHDIWKLMTQSS